MSVRTPARRALRVLLVEDNPGDVLLMEEALADSAVSTELAVVRNGEAALSFLRGEHEFAGRARPDIVLLDLSLPGRSGGSVLTEIKGDPALRSTPVIVLSSSTGAEDVADSYDQHCNTYVVKPMGFADYHQVMRHIEDYWTTAAQLPPSP